MLNNIPLPQESVGSGVARTPTQAPSSRYSSSSSLGSSRGEDAICSLNLRQMIETGEATQANPVILWGHKKAANGCSIDAASGFPPSKVV